MSTIQAPVSRRRSWKLVAVLLLALVLGWVAVLGYQYATTRKPVQDLPAVPGIGRVIPKTPPRFLTSFYGPKDELLARPLGVAASPRGDRLYATQGSGKRTTVVLDRAGKVMGELVPPDTQPGGRTPLYVAVDGAGTVFISDVVRAKIDRYSPQGDYQGVFTPAEGNEAPYAPMAMTFDRDGLLYVTDLKPGHHRVLIYAPDGTLKSTFGDEGDKPGEFSYPNGIAVDSRGSIYVADSNNGRVQIFDQDGHFVDILGREGRGGMGIPRGLAIDDSGRLFITDLTNDVVQVWDLTADRGPVKLYDVGRSGVLDGSLNHPNSVAVDATGRLYVADRANNRLGAWAY